MPVIMLLKYFMASPGTMSSMKVRNYICSEFFGAEKISHKKGIGNEFSDRAPFRLNLLQTLGLLISWLDAMLTPSFHSLAADT
jgi:hypothetical protein